MKIIDIEKKFPAFDAPNGLAHCLISAGLAEKFTPPADDKQAPNTVWTVRVPGPDTTHLGLVAKCATCGGGIDFFFGKNPEVAELRHKAFCGGGFVENPPPDVCAQYRAEHKRCYPPATLGEKVEDKLASLRRDLRDGLLAHAESR